MASLPTRLLPRAILAIVAATTLGAIAVQALGSQGVDRPATATEPADRGVTATTAPPATSTPPNTTVPPQTSGPLSAPHPTIENISVLWDTVGDANGNSTVTVRFREHGAATWLPAMPLRRVPAGSNEGFSWTARHAGSIFGVQPGTTYEIEASFVDPDGPHEVRVISATTRTVPVAMTGASIRPATPATIDSVLGTAIPGDVIELAAGAYGGFIVDNSGQAGEPIVVRGTPGAIVNGEIGIFSQDYVHIEDLTINGRIRFNGSDNVSITHNTINTTDAFGGHGILTYLRAEDSYIADNTVNGLTVWEEASLGVSGANKGEGILVTGPGHVIEHNRVTGMRDGISFLEEHEAVDQFSIDVLNNDISEAADDGIEADFCQHNCRIVDNRITNTFIALSSQPSLGGPTYFVRNSVYNVAHVAFKLYRGSNGDVLLHNTVVKSGDAFGIYAGRDVSNLFMRNNLFIGGPGATYNGFSNGSGRTFQVGDLIVASADTDYDGFGSTTGSFTGNFGPVSFDSLASMHSGTTEQHATQVDLGVFAAPVAMPTNAMTQFAPPDLRLAASSAATNAGAALPTINDNAASGAPDLGALEAGASAPTYGPR